MSFCIPVNLELDTTTQRKLDEIIALLRHLVSPAKGIVITFGTPVTLDGKKVTNMVNTPLPAGMQIPYIVNEVDGSTPPVVVPPSPGDTVVVTCSDTTVATVVPHSIVAPGSPGSGFVVAGTKPGVNTVTITATGTRSDGTTIGTTTALLDVGSTTPIKAAGVTLSFGTPVPQTPPPPAPPVVQPIKS